MVVKMVTILFDMLLNVFQLQWFFEVDDYDGC